MRSVLQVLREHHLYANMSKYSFYQSKIHYLGHIISKEGIAMTLENIEAIMGWPTPHNVSEVRSFVELVGYYRIFIECFSKVVRPIT